MCTYYTTITGVHLIQLALLQSFIRTQNSLSPYQRQSAIQFVLKDVVLYLGCMGLLQVQVHLYPSECLQIPDLAEGIPYRMMRGDILNFGILQWILNMHLL